MVLVPLSVFGTGPPSDGCDAAAARHAELVLEDLPCFLLGWCSESGDVLRLSKAREWAEIFHLRHDRWPADGEVFADGLTNRWGHPYLTVVGADGAFALVDPGADGQLGSRCGYAEEADLWSSQLR